MSVRLTTAIRIGDAAKAVYLKTKSFPDELILEKDDVTEFEHIGVEPMLLALSMELALKAWFVFDYDNPKFMRSHNLIKLFERLKPESQQKLDNEFKKTVALTHPSFFYVDYGIRDVLEQHKNAFTDWRYLHEGKDSMTFDLGTFEATLEMVLREFRKLYRIEKIPSLHTSE